MDTGHEVLAAVIRKAPQRKTGGANVRMGYGKPETEVQIGYCLLTGFSLQCGEKNKGVRYICGLYL